MHEIEPIEERERLQQEDTRELLGALFDDAKELIREEVAQAKTDLQHEVNKARMASTAIGAGAILGLIAAMVFAFALVALLSLVMPMWLSAAIVSCVLAVAGLVAINTGKNKLKRIEPRMPLEIVKEDARWIQKTVQGIQSHRREHTLH